MTRLNEEKTVLAYKPTLVALLLRAEELKGSSLTENEVFKIKNISQTMKVLKSVANMMEQERGYADINSNNCWVNWQIFRLENK